MAEAGGESEAFQNGRARRMLIVPAAEHILILFRRVAHQSTLEWLDSSFGRDSASTYIDVRIGWYLLNLLGWVTLIGTASSFLKVTAENADDVWRRGGWSRWIVMPFVASALVAIVNRLIPVRDLGGIMVGGAAGLWFLLVGAGWLGMGVRPSTPAVSDLFWGLVLFALLWIAVGVMAQFVVLNWFLVTPRLVRWPLMSMAFVPWLLATGHVQQRTTISVRLLLWVIQSLLLSSGLFVLALLIPSLGVLILILPLIPLIFGMMMLAGTVIERAWSFAIGNALFFGWVMVAYFPMGG